MADLLLRSQVQRIEHIFTCFAKHIELSDGSNVEGITTVELRAVLQALGLHPTDAELHEIISRSDTHGRGYLDSAEFVQLLSGELGDIDNEIELVDVFNEADNDRDGLLEPMEIAAAIAAAVPPGTEAATADQPLTIADITAVIEEAAGPGAKGMTLQQFVNFMRTQR